MTPARHAPFRAVTLNLFCDLSADTWRSRMTLVSAQLCDFAPDILRYRSGHHGLYADSRWVDDGDADDTRSKQP